MEFFALDKIDYDKIDYRYIVVVIMATFYVLEQYLRYRKRSALLKGFPKGMEGLVTEEEYKKSYDYNLYKNSWGYALDLHATVYAVVSMYYWGALWNFSAPQQHYAHAALADKVLGNSYAQICMFLVYSSLVEFVVGLPKSLVITFHIEEIFGFNKYTLKSYTKETIMKFFEGLLINLPLMFGMVYIVDIMGPDAWFYLWLFLSAFVFAFNTLYPIVCARMYNSYTELEPGKLKDGIDNLITETGLNCKNVFMVDGSKQSSHSNAYVNGMCMTKRIVIYDTLLKDLNHDCEKTLAVVGHEIGHSILHHNWALLLVTMGNLFVLFFSYGVFQSTPSIVTSFGFSENETGNAFLKIQCFMAVYGMAVMPIWSILMNAFVRQLEFAADRYAVRLGHDISSSLLKISITNKADFNPDWLHSWYHLSHPPPDGTNGGGKSISGNAF